MNLPGVDAPERDRELSQWVTPPWLAERVWEWAKQGGSHGTVLEPSAGDGALLRPMLAEPGELQRVMAVEIDRRYTLALSSLVQMGPPPHLQVMLADFLAAPSDLLGRFDLALLNPPYEHGQTERFILAALAVSDRAVCIAQTSVLHGQARYAQLWRHVDVSRGVILSARPSFGGGSPARDFVVLELRRRAHPREPGEAMQCSWSWW